MLTEIRDRSSGFFAYVIAALIIIPMAFWGIQEYASTEAVPTIVEVGDQKITQNFFQSSLSNAQANARERNPNLANTDILNSDFFKKQVLQDLIDRAIIEHVADEQNYLIGDEQLANLIKRSSLFQRDGAFDIEAYEAYVQSRAYSKTQFENETRANGRIGQVASGYQESALVLPDEVRELLEIQAEQRGFDLITISQSDYIDEITVTDEEIDQYYQDNINDYLEPDRISVSYVELDIEQIASEVEVTEDEIRDLYEDNIDSYVSKETRNTRHILLSTGGDNDEDTQLAKAQELVGLLKGGADFAALAKENSQDPGSASNGGSLGEVELGVMVPEFEQATFALAEGEISEPVKSQFGYHIIQVEKINGGKPQSFDEVKFDLEQEERDRKAEDRLLERLEQMRDLVFEQPESLEGVAAGLQLEVKTSDLFSRSNGTGLASNEAIRSVAFSEQVLVDELNSEPIELGNGVYVAIRKHEFKEAAPKPLVDVSTEIKTQLTNQRASEAAKQAGDVILEKAKNNWSSVADDETVNVSSYKTTMLDTEPTVNPSVLREVMRMHLNGADSKVTSLTDTDGNFNIIRLTDITPGDLSLVSEQVKDSARRLIAQRNGQSLFQSYLQGLNSELNLQVNEDLL